MLSLFGHFFPEHVVALVTTREIDFSLNTQTTGLSWAQKISLKGLIAVDPSFLASPRQVHGRKVLLAPGKNFKNKLRLQEADGVVTNVSHIPLGIRTADCLSIFMYDPDHEAIGLIHAGWRGTKEGIIFQAVKLMQKEFFSKAQNLKAAFGPAIRRCCYRVGEEFVVYFPEGIIRKDEGFYFDLALANQRQLLNAGLKEKNIFDCAICTCCDKRYFSYRREGPASGRMLSLMMLNKIE